VIKDHWAWFLKSNPIYATSLGVHDYDDRIGDFSLAEADRQAEQAAIFIKRLDAIPLRERQGGRGGARDF